MAWSLAMTLSIGLASFPLSSQTPDAATPQSPEPTGPKVVIHTTAGDMHCQLFDKQAPKAVSNFVGLATGTKDWKDPVTHKTKHGVPLYDGTIFHRVIPSFMIQGGDPQGTGEGDPGYKFEDETDPKLLFDRPGRLAMANSGPNTNGSQFFITEVPTPHLDGKYSLFGQCDDDTVELVKRIARMATDERNNRPYNPITIKHIDILGTSAAASGTPHK